MKTNQITDALNSMTRDELRAAATQLGVTRGKEKVNTVQNLVAAINENKVRFTLAFYLRPNTNPDSVIAPTVYAKKLRTHKKDKVMVPPPTVTATA